MGSFATLYFSGYPVDSTRNYLDQWIFKEGDKRIYERRPAERNDIIFGDNEDQEEPEVAYVFEVTVETAIKRLEVLGYTLPRCKHDFQESLRKGIDMIAGIEKLDGNFGSLCRSIYSRYDSWEEWFNAFSIIVKDRPGQVYPFCDPERVHEDELVNFMLNPIPLWIDDWYPWGFQYPCQGFDFLARAFLESCDRSSVVQLDATDLVAGGWFDGFSLIEDIGGPHTKFFTIFEASTIEVLELLHEGKHYARSELLSKVLYANIITALEAYLSDTLIYTVINLPAVMRSVVEGDPEFGRKKLDRKDLYRELDCLKDQVVTYLENVAYHNLSKVKELYRSALSVEFPGETEYIYKAIKDRHDIVHRNGRRRDGSIVRPDLASVQELMSKTLDFVRQIDVQVRNVYPDAHV